MCLLATEFNFHHAATLLSIFQAFLHDFGYEHRFTSTVKTVSILISWLLRKSQLIRIYNVSKIGYLRAKHDKSI